MPADCSKTASYASSSLNYHVSDLFSEPVCYRYRSVATIDCIGCTDIILVLFWFASASLANP